MRRRGCARACALLLLAQSCAPASVETVKLELLANAAPVELRSEHGFALAPDSTRLVWEREFAGAPPRLEFFELGARRSRAIEWSPQALAALGSTPLVSWTSRCWTADSREVYARVEGGWLRASSADDPPLWSVCAEAPSALVEAPVTPVEGLVRVEARPDRLVLRAASDGRVLAEHTPSGVLRSRIELRAGSLRASHDGTWISYVLVDAGDSWVGPPTLYVLAPKASAPAPLRVSAKCWGAPQWSTRETRLYFVHAVDGQQAVVASWSP